MAKWSLREEGSEQNLVDCVKKDRLPIGRRRTAAMDGDGG